MPTKYPTIRNTIDALKPLLPEGFVLVVHYSGYHDNGWFDGMQLTTADDKNIDKPEASEIVEGILDSNKAAIERELYDILETRFPGWEIGDGEVNGSTGKFYVDSKACTIRQHHEIDFCSQEDISPKELENF